MTDEYKFHEAANIFPLLEGNELNGLVADIKQHGLLTPIELFDGKIIDGRNRKTACLLAGVTPEFIEVSPDDPVAYVLSKNLRRRQLNETQKGLVAQRAREIYERQAKERQAAGQAAGGKARHGDSSLVTSGSPSSKGKSREQAGASVGVSGITVDRVRDALKTGTPELVKAMERGEVKASTAKRIAKLPPNEQREVLSGSKPAPAARKHGTDGRPEVRHPASTAMEFAQIAISHLERISGDDPDRDKAFAKVEKWISAQRSE